MHHELIQAANQLLGNRVTYCRLDEIGQERDGSGNVCSIHLDERRRPMVRIMDSGRALNIDVAAINLSPEERKAYFEAAKAVRERTDKLNHQLITKKNKYDDEIDAMQNKYLGYPIELQQAPMVEEAKEQETAA